MARSAETYRGARRAHWKKINDERPKGARRVAWVDVNQLAATAFQDVRLRLRRRAP